MHSSIGYYIESLKTFVRNNKVYNDFLFKKDVTIKIDAIVDFFNLTSSSIQVLKNTEKPIADFDFIFLQRIITVCLCEDVWMKKQIELTIQNRTNVQEKIIRYLIYKTLAIISKYPNYQELSINIFTAIDFVNDTNIMFNLREHIEKAVDKILDDVKNEKTHITLKIRQCLNFGQCHPYYDVQYNDDEIKFVDISNFYKKIIKIGDKALKNTYDYFFPPIFGVDILLEHIEADKTTQIKRERKTVNNNNLFIQCTNKKYSLLSQLSSGERQQINTVSSIIYHLKNVNSVSNDKGKLVKYQHVNLIFEEIELYFHPEFQRTFLNFLLKNLSKTKLELKSVNLCFVTHSPFILSDIPHQNIMVLDKGKSKICPLKTLGANIHEMLANDFLLEYTIGEHTKGKIDMFIEEYLKYQKNDYNNDIKSFITQHNIKFLIDNMGEGYLKSILKGYYEDMIKNTSEGLSQLIEEKELELQNLKNRLSPQKK